MHAACTHAPNQWCSQTHPLMRPHAPACTPLTRKQKTPGTLELMVDDDDEVEAAALLLRSMYSVADPSKPLQGARAGALLRVVVLADQLRAEACGSAAARAPAGASNLEWATVLQAYSLPDAFQ